MYQKKLKYILQAYLFVLLTSCGGSGGGTPSDNTDTDTALAQEVEPLLSSNKDLLTMPHRMAGTQQACGIYQQTVQVMATIRLATQWNQRVLMIPAA